MYKDLVMMLHEQAMRLPEKLGKNAELFGALTKAADAIEELSKCMGESIPKSDVETIIAEVAKPRWIPVTERLPKAERKSYWVCTDTGYQCKCRWTNNRFGIGESNEWSWSIFDIPQYQKVIAWMPLPCPYEPPKENRYAD